LNKKFPSEDPARVKQSVKGLDFDCNKVNLLWLHVIELFAAVDTSKKSDIELSYLICAPVPNAGKSLAKYKSRPRYIWVRRLT